MEELKKMMNAAIIDHEKANRQRTRGPPRFFPPFFLRQVVVFRNLEFYDNGTPDPIQTDMMPSTKCPNIQHKTQAYPPHEVCRRVGSLVVFK